MKQIKPAPIQKTLVVINNFVVNTAEFFNAFSETVEKKISAVSSKITELEILLSVFEAKLNSVPGLEFSSDDLPQTEAPPAAKEEYHAPQAPHHAPEPSLPAAAVATSETVAEAAAPAAEAATDSSQVKASDHPDYAQYFRLLKVGVPVFVVQAKVSAAGLDPSIIETPDAMMSV